jgi:hypothetical protein
MTLRNAVIGTVVALGALVGLWILNESPRLLGELLILAAVVMLAFFIIRAAWIKWKAQSQRLWSFGLLGCFGVAIGGWLAVGVMAAIIGAVGDSYAMIIVAPLMLIFSMLAGLAGLGAAILGVAVIAGAFTKPTRNPALLMFGGAVSFVLNVGFIWAMVKIFG